jgi:hypothetical protein
LGGGGQGGRRRGRKPQQQGFWRRLRERPRAQLCYPPLTPTPAEIVATRTGRAVIKSLGYHQPEMVSTMEGGNRAMLSAAAAGDGGGVSYGGAPGGMTASDFAKTTSIQFGTAGTTKESDYRAHFADYVAAAPAGGNPYASENRVHEVDPSALGNKPSDAPPAGVNARTMLVAGPGGKLVEVTRVKSAVDVGRDAPDPRSVYMAATGAGRVWLTRVGGWSTHTVPLLPEPRVRFASNANHPAVLAAKAAAGGV